MSPVFWNDTKPPLDFKKQAMTPSHNNPQGTAGSEQQKHCEHECVCGEFKMNPIFGSGVPCSRNREGCRDCINDTRPHTSAQAPALIITDMEGDAIGDCSDCEAHYESMGEIDRLPCGKAHDAAIRTEAAKAAREDVLKEKQTLVALFFERIQSRAYSNDNLPIVYLCDIESELESVMQSLRSQQEAERPKEERR